MSNSLVYLVDDNNAFRKSTAWLLEGAGYRVREFGSGEELLRTLHLFRRGKTSACLLSDVRMPEMSGLELQDELSKQKISLPVVFVTAHGDVPLAVEAMRRGAIDFVEKPFSEEVIVAAVQRAFDEFPKRTDSNLKADEKIDNLTPREREVMELVVASKPNKIIAYLLGISIKTVELHRANMMSKLGVRNLPDLMKLILGRGQ